MKSRDASHVDLLQLQMAAPVRSSAELVAGISLLRKLTVLLEQDDGDEWRAAQLAALTEWAVCYLLPVPGQPASGGMLRCRLMEASFSASQICRF